MKKELIKKISRWGMNLAVVAFVVCALIWKGTWWPLVEKYAAQIVATTKQAAPAGHDHGAEEDDHEGHEGHGGGGEVNSLELSEQARRNIGLSSEYLQPLKLQTYYRTLSVPGMIVEQPGRSRIDVSAPLTGLILEIYHVEGETVTPGTPLFKIRLTHQDLVQIQTEFLKSVGELKVEEKEIIRLEKVTQSGAVVGRKLLERQYGRDKMLALLNSQRESLRLHGLSLKQIKNVEQTGHLLQELIVVADSPIEHRHGELQLSGTLISPVKYVEKDKHDPELVIQNLQVDKGQIVPIGQLMCELVDYSSLYIEGKAFEGDAASLASAMKKGWTVTALLETSQGLKKIPNLDLAYISNIIGTETRTLPFFIDLPNELLRDETNKNNRRYITWRFRPGQRLQLQIPIEEWNDEFVLPVDALAKEGAEYFVFQENGKHFDRIPVHVKFKDQTSAVIANDGSLFPGDIVAMRSAHQMLIAIKNKSGGAVDPHAGHNH